MQSVLDRLEKAKASLAAAENNRLRLLGKQEGAMEELALLGYPSVKKAQAAVKSMDAELDEMEEKLEGLLNEFNEKYGKFLEG